MLGASIYPEESHIKIEFHPIYSRLRKGWYKQFHESMLVSLNCYDAYMRDSNLSVYNDINKPSEKHNANESSEKYNINFKNEINLDIFKNPCITSAIVEYIDAGAMKRIISECRDQSDYKQLRKIHIREFKRAATEISISIDHITLSEIWTGCLSAAKGISPINYWIGPITPWHRFNIFKFIVFPLCQINRAYKLGALAAIHFKAWRQEPITLEGVPLRTFNDPDFNKWNQYISRLYNL